MWCPALTTTVGDVINADALGDALKEVGTPPWVCETCHKPDCEGTHMRDVPVRDTSGKLYDAYSNVVPQHVCPACGRNMQEQHCKLICACGYFVSCSE